MKREIIFSNSLIIDEDKTKENKTTKEVHKCDLNIIIIIQYG